MSDVKRNCAVLSSREYLPRFVPEHRIERIAGVVRARLLGVVHVRVQLKYLRVFV